LQLAKNDGDIYANYSGVPGYGKSTSAIRDGVDVVHFLRHDFDIDIPKFSLKRNVVYKPEAKDINDLLSYAKYNVKVFDEGYLVAMNIMPIDRFLIEFIQTINITRSKNNMISFCFQNMDRAVRALKERFNIWIHKPFKDRAYLFARSNLFITKDPWATGNLLKAFTDEQIMYHLRHNPNKVGSFKTYPLKPKQWEYYTKMKNEGQETTRKEREIREGITSATNELMEEIYKKISVDKSIAYADIGDYLRDTYDFSEPEIKGTVRRYLRYEEMRKIRGVMEKRGRPI